MRKGQRMNSAWRENFSKDITTEWAEMGVTEIVTKYTRIGLVLRDSKFHVILFNVSTSLWHCHGR